MAIALLKLKKDFVKVFNVKFLLKTLVNGFEATGVYTIELNASELNINSGVYIYKLEAGSFTQTRKMTLMK